MVRYIRESLEDEFDEFNFGDENAKWYASVEVPKECIKGATLLSVEEYKKYKNNTPKLNGSWWLRSAGSGSNCACFVCYDIYGGRSVDDNYISIRPSLILDMQSSDIDFDIGDKFEFGAHTFTILSNDLAICDDFIGRGCFRKDWESEDANVYEKSDVKKIVDNWFAKSYAE